MNIRKAFYHELLQPYQALVVRSYSNDLVDPTKNDLSAKSTALAVTAAHFLEVYGLSKDGSIEEELHLKLRDVSDSTKHGTLRNKRRIVEISVALAYEVNAEELVRFYRTEVEAKNEIFNSFNLVDALGYYLRSINARFNFGFSDFEPAQTLTEFGPLASCYISDNTADVKSVRIKFYKRNQNGQLQVYDPSKMRFAVL